MLFFTMTAILASAAAQEKPSGRTDAFGDPLPRGAVARIGTIRFRHGGPVERLAMSPDGKVVASAGRDAVRLWDARTGKELRALAGHMGEVRCLAFAPDAATLVTGGSDGAVRLWEVDSGKKRKNLFKAKDWVNAVAASRDGKLIAAAFDDGSVHVWDAASFGQVREFHPEGGASRLAFAPDGKTLVVGASDESAVSVWAAESGSRQRGFGGWGQALAVSADGSMLAVANDENEVALFDLRAGKQLRTLDAIERRSSAGLLRIHALAWMRQQIVAALSDGRLVSWNAATGKRSTNASVSREAILAIAATEDGKRLAWAGTGGVIVVAEELKAKDSEQQVSGAGIVGVALSPDGKTLATVARDATFRIFETETAKFLAADRLEKTSLEAVVFSPDGSLLVTGTGNGGVEVRDPKTGRRQDLLTHHSSAVRRLAFIPQEGKQILVSAAGRSIGVIDLKAHTAVKEIGLSSARVESLSVSPDGNRAFLADGAAEFSAVTLATAESSSFDGHPGGALTVTCSPSGRLVVSGGRDALLRIWEVGSRKQRKAFGGQPGWPLCVAWSPDGAVIASAHADGTVRLWDGITAKLLQELTGHRGPVRSLSFSADGKRLATAGDDTTALVWDIPALVQAGRLAVEPLTKERLQSCWVDLAADDAGTADQAVQALARAPAQTLPLLAERLKPVTRKQLDDWLRDLDSPKFAVRDAANKHLAAMGRSIEPLLKQVLVGKPSLELHRRVSDLIDQFTREGPPPEELQILRALEVLEMIGSDEARKILRALAGGAPDCGITIEARATLERMTRGAKP